MKNGKGAQRKCIEFCEKEVKKFRKRCKSLHDTKGLTPDTKGLTPDCLEKGTYVYIHNYIK